MKKQLLLKKREIEMKKSILFVYNADSGIFNTVTDIAHKIFSPQSYECNLCAITYGNFAIKGEWKEFLETLDAELEFLHRDEFIKKYRLSEVALPAVFLKSAEGLELWINAAEINSCSSVDDVKKLITVKMAA
jgi:hypothetical protein